MAPDLNTQAQSFWWQALYPSVLSWQIHSEIPLKIPDETNPVCHLWHPVISPTHAKKYVNNSKLQTSKRIKPISQSLILQYNTLEKHTVSVCYFDLKSHLVFPNGLIVVYWAGLCFKALGIFLDTRRAICFLMGVVPGLDCSLGLNRSFLVLIQ